MTCGKEFGTGSCVCNVLKNIARAQSDIVDSNKCLTSCDRSISDLLGETEVRNHLNTVPVMLYCSSTCQPFKGYGAHPHSIGNIESSFYFRVKNVDDNCCAVIELLRDPNDSIANPHDPCEQYTKELRTTGICMTVDLKAFSHVTCLPAIAAF